ncbi:hypothetical protein DZF91_24130, partial [Actinomadura logoneensis]
MELIIAVVLATMISRAWEESRAQARTKWEQARAAAAERRADAEERRSKAAAARNRRARRSGPSDPLWWVWATGWTAAAAVRGTVAAVQGARQGAR